MRPRYARSSSSSRATRRRHASAASAQRSRFMCRSPKATSAPMYLWRSRSRSARCQSPTTACSRKSPPYSVSASSSSVVSLEPSGVEVPDDPRVQRVLVVREPPPLRAAQGLAEPVQHDVEVVAHLFDRRVGPERESHLLASASVRVTQQEQQQLPRLHRSPDERSGRLRDPQGTECP